MNFTTFLRTPTSGRLLLQWILSVLFCEKDALKSFANSQENTCPRVSFLISCRLRPETLLKNSLRHGCFPVNFEIF